MNINVNNRRHDEEYEILPVIRHHFKEINEKLATRGWSIGKKLNVLGMGESGIVVRLSPDVVMKCTADLDFFNNEVKFLKKLGKVKSRLPLAPKLIGKFKIGKGGFIVMQDATRVYKNANRTVEFKKMSRSDKKSSLKSLGNAINRLHKQGIEHADLHDGNVWVAWVNGKPHVFFIDFGVSFNRKNFKNSNKDYYTGFLTGYVKQHPHPNLDIDITQDNDMYSKYLASV